MDLKKIIAEKEDQNGFIKVTDKPVAGLSSEQRVILNRKGNILFNQGQFDNAKRIFITTGYSDGLTRIGDKYCEDKRELDGLKMYLLAHNKTKSDAIIEKLAQVISKLID